MPLPALSRGEFAARLAACSPEELPAAVVAALHAHYRILRRWNPALSLIGPGTRNQVVERHYGEALAALPLIGGEDKSLADLGTGAGFPGFVLAAARPRLEVTLVEARERKWSFLMSACREAGLSCRCLNARVGRALPEGFPASVDILTSRALRLERPQLQLLADGLGPGGRFLLWRGRGPLELPPGWARGARLPLPGGSGRWIEEVRRIS